jgi:molybdate transport system substrate-binding protein
MRKLMLITTVFMAMSLASEAVAAEIKLLGSPGVRGIIEELGPRFQAKTGHKIVGDFEVIAKIKKRIDDGESFDITVLSPEAIASLIADKKIDHQAPFARVGMGIGFRKGAVKPDVSSADALRKTLLAACSVVYSAQGLSGKAYLALVERLGITSDMKDKSKADDSQTKLDLAACGGVELVATSMSTIALNKGLELAGPFPPDLQMYVVFNVGVSSQTVQKSAAEQFLEFVKSAEATPLFAERELDR